MKKMYFGTKERMTWVNCPAVDVDLSRGEWITEGIYLNGGAYVRRTQSGHKRYAFSWNLASQEDAYDIVDYAEGLYGNGLIYFYEPFAMNTNVLPQVWATPRLARDNGVSLVRGKRPTLTPTAPNSLKYPTQSAVYTLNNESEFDSLYLPVPPDHTLHIGAHGSATGTATITVTGTGTPTVTTRHNLITNPSFETGTSGLWASGVTLTTTDYAPAVLVGSQAVAITASGVSAASPYQVVQAEAGRWVAISIPLRWSGGSRYVQLRIIPRDAGGAWLPSVPFSEYVYGQNSYQWITHSLLMPPGTVDALVRVYFYDDTSATQATAGTLWHTDAWMTAMADTEAEALAAVETYFDGDSPDTSVGTVTVEHTWNGAAHDSPSTETTIDDPATPVSLDMLAVNNPMLTNYTTSKPVTLSAQGVGTLTLAGLVAQVLPNGEPPPTGSFKSGRGHSGCRFAGMPTVTGYSAVLDKVSVSATLVETGSWETD